MKEVVLGVGQQGSLWSVVRIADEQLRSIHGSPKRMVVRSRGVEIEAARPGFEGDFQSFTVKFPGAGAKLREAIKGCAAKAPGAWQVAEDNGALVLRCAGSVAESGAKTHEACDDLSKVFTLPEVWRVHGEEYRSSPLSPELLCRAMAQFKASDAHLYPGASPVFRVDGVLRRGQGFEPLSSPQILDLIQAIAPEKHYAEFVARQQCSFIYHQVGVGYARVSAFLKAGVPHCTMRFLPESIPSFEELNIPRDAMEALGHLHFGLILVTGMTGSGKSTTVAALVDWINANRSAHVLCIEEPVEFVHKSKKSVVSQRDVGEDVGSFHEAVRGALRHDPDVIVIGEMRDPDTIRSAINAAATGHLVVSTLHSGTAYETVNRIVSFFDPVERDLVRLQLRDALKCVICQRLVPRIGGGRMPALEFLFNDAKPIADSILSGNTAGLKVGMQQTASRSFVFEKYLYDLLAKEKITEETARAFATEPQMLEQMRLGTYAIPSLEAMLHGHGHR